jgi:Na+/H+ antiporter NhaC
MLPTVVFLIACAMSFSTGTSWGTMAVLMPIGVPLAYASGTAAHLPMPDMQFTLMLTIASTLAGAVFGDHCSLISDTTILASLSSKCGLYEHFSTQMPYAVLAAVVTIVCGTLPASLGVPVWICLPAGFLGLILGVRVLGTSVETHGRFNR